MLVRINAVNFAIAHYWMVQDILLMGDRIKTDYDKDDEPKSADLSIALVIRDPWKEPVIFSKCVYDSAGSLLRYRDEVVYGTMDDKVDELTYTYHDRFADQIDGVLDELRRNPHTRRAQMITWRKEEDLGAEYPPCFQRLWLRVIDGKLEMHTTWRSRDIWKAWGSNTFAFAHLHKWFAEQLDYPAGDYMEWIDSAHIYGRDIEAARSASERAASKWEWHLEDIEEQTKKGA